MRNSLLPFSGHQGPPVREVGELCPVQLLLLHIGLYISHSGVSPGSHIAISAMVRRRQHNVGCNSSKKTDQRVAASLSCDKEAH